MNSTAKSIGKPTGKTAQPNRRAAEKKKKTIVLAAVSGVLVIALVIALIVVIRKANTPALTTTTQYTVNEVTVGNVSTTVSGSGSLTPITSRTLTAAELLGAAEETDETDETEEDTEETGTEAAGDDGTGALADSGIETGTGSNAGSGLPASPQTPAIAGGSIQSLNVQVGDTVEQGEVLAVIAFGSAETADGEDGSEKASTANILAPYDTVILEWYLQEGDEVSDDTEVGLFMGTDGYTLNISVDETNIASVGLGQDVEISIDASSEEMPIGTVTDISYNGSTSGSTAAYKITVTFDYVAGTYPGMGVSAEIVIEDSGDGLLVPVSAVQTSGDTKYVYLAPSGASLADVYEDGELDTADLTKVTVTTGMSDGSYIIIESGNLDEGDLIVSITRTSTQTGTDGSGSSGGMGGFGDLGGMGSFPGGDFDFGDFDPSQFPSGSFPFGN